MALHGLTPRRCFRDHVFRKRHRYTRQVSPCLLQELRKQRFGTPATLLRVPAPGPAFTFHGVGFQSTAQIRHPPVVDVDLVDSIRGTQLHELPQFHYCAAKVHFVALNHRVGRQGMFCWVRHFACCYQAPRPEKTRSFPSTARELPPFCLTSSYFLLLGEPSEEIDGTRAASSPDLFVCVKLGSERRKRMGERSGSRTTCHDDWCPQGVTEVLVQGR